MRSASGASPNETTPLSNSRNRTPFRTNCWTDEVRCTGADNSHTNMDDTKRILAKIAIDIIVLCFVGFPILFFFLWGDPYKRGFFCDDESLMHPFHDSTVPNWMLYIIGLVLPLGLIILCEIVRARTSPEARSMRLYNIDVPASVRGIYKQIGVFGFGAACSQLATDIAKYSIGRLRPHFFSVCQPIMTNGLDCSAPANRERYIEEFTCQNEGSSARMLKEMRLSFPSGHSSFSMYTMVYCAIYLHSRMRWRGSQLLRHFIQFLLIMLSWFTCLSRISDYKHHWSDVLAGAVLGATVALIVTNFVSDLLVRKPAKPQNSAQQTRYELTTPTNGRV